MVLVAAATLVAVAALAPVAQLVLRAGSRGWERTAALVLRQRTLDLLVNTVIVTGIVSLACLVLGIATAYACTRIRLPGQRLWLVLACLPLAVPSFVGAFAWTATWPGVTGRWPLALVLTLTCVPLVTIPTIGAFALIDEGLADVARTLGRGRATTFIRITLPQVLPAAGAGTLLVALYTISDFGSPAIMRYQTLTTGVYALFRGSIDRSAAAAMSLPLLALSITLVVIERRLRRRPGTLSAPRRPARLMLSPLATALIGGGLALVAAVSVLAPLAALIRRSLLADRYAVTAAEIGSAAVTSLVLAAVAATVTVAAALPISYLLARFRGRWLGALEASTLIGYAMPAVVVALALVALSLAVVPWAYQSVGALVAAYVVLSLPLAVGSSRAGFARVSARAEDASRTLGAGPLRSWWRISIAGALPGIAAGWLLVVAEVLKELPATLMLRPIGLDTLATELWSKTTIGAYGAGAPIAVILVVVGILPAVILARSVRGRLE